MASKSSIVSQIYIKVNGEGLEPKLTGQIIEIVVDQHACLPGMFTIRLHDPGLKLLDTGPFNLATPVEISSPPPTGEPVNLIKGEITALEPQFGEGMIAELLVRGYDLSHRLYRAIKSKTYLNVKDSDLADQFASAYGLQGDIEVTRTVYDHLYQHNQSDLQFLMQRAWRIGYECFVDGEKLVFRRPVHQQLAATLAWGDDLLSFTPRMTLAEQVEKVVIKGWDIQKKAPIIGQAEQGRLYPKIEEIEQEHRDGKEWAKKVGNGSKLVIVDQPVVSQAEADILAAARLDELSGVFVEAEGIAFRRPDIRAGQSIKLQALGKRFSGDYWVTSATHIYTSTGLKTNFTVSGTRLGLFTAQGTHPAALDRWPGTAPAIVTNTDDPKQWGRVKVKFPWMSDEDESDWVRVVSSGGGPQAGFSALPAVDDEVLVAFVHGNFGQPVVLGGLWNGQDAAPPPIQNAPQGEKPLVRTWHSRTGHRITMFDNNDNKLEVSTADGHTVTLDDATHKITVSSKGKLAIVLDDDGRAITIESGGKVIVKADQDVEVSAGANLQLKATGNLQIEAQGNLQMRANGAAKLEATAQVAVSAPQISLG